MSRSYALSLAPAARPAAGTAVGVAPRRQLLDTGVRRYLLTARDHRSVGGGVVDGDPERWEIARRLVRARLQATALPDYPGALPPSREIAYGLTTSTDANGDVHLKGTLDPVTGEAVLTAIELEAKKILTMETEAEPISYRSSTSSCPRRSPKT